MKKTLALVGLLLLGACSGGGNSSLTPQTPDAAQGRPADIVAQGHNRPPGGDPTITGDIFKLISGGFQIHNASCGYLNVFTNGSTVYSPTGYTPHANDNVTVVGTGSCSTNINPATSVTCNTGQCGGTPTPSPSPTPTPGPTQAYQGCQIFASTDLINQNQASTATDANSSAIISNLGSVAFDPTSGFGSGKASEQYNLATNATQTYTVTPTGSWNPPIYGSSTMPWATGDFISSLRDHHGMVLNTSVCKAYEGYEVTFNGTSLTASGGHMWDLTQPMANQYATPEHSGGANAADLPYIAMALFSDRDAGGTSINHAIGFIFPTTGTAAWGYVRPSDSSTGVGCTTAGCSATHMIYGERLRLHSSFTLSCITGNTCPQTAAIVQAAKTYGIIYYDQGSAFGFDFFNSPGGVNSWNSTDLSNLSGMHISDFDVMSRAAAGGAICPSGKTC